MEFNQCSDELAAAALQPCAHISTWIDALVQHRPYASTDQLYDAAAQHASTWQWADIEQALAQHPRIGHTTAAAPLTKEEQQFSANEQSSVQSSLQVEQALLQGNIDYEQQFGFIFLIRATGRSGQEILTELQRRLGNSTAQEQLEVGEQMAEIALLRLKQRIVA